MFPHTCVPCVRSIQAKQKKVTRTPGDSRPPPSAQAHRLNQRAKASKSSARTVWGKLGNYKNNSGWRFLHKR